MDTRVMVCERAARLKTRLVAGCGWREKKPARRAMVASMEAQLPGRGRAGGATELGRGGWWC